MIGFGCHFSSKHFVIHLMNLNISVHSSISLHSSIFSGNIYIKHIVIVLKTRLLVHPTYELNQTHFLQL